MQIYPCEESNLFSILTWGNMQDISDQNQYPLYQQTVFFLSVFPILNKNMKNIFNDFISFWHNIYVYIDKQSNLYKKGN